MWSWIYSEGKEEGEDLQTSQFNTNEPDIDDYLSQKQEEYETIKSKRLKYEKKVMQLKNKEEALLSELNSLKGQRKTQEKKTQQKQIAKPKPKKKKYEEEYEDDEEYNEDNYELRDELRDEDKNDEMQEYGEEEEEEESESPPPLRKQRRQTAQKDVTRTPAARTPAKIPAKIQEPPVSRPNIATPVKSKDKRTTQSAKSNPQASHNKCFDQECCEKQNEYKIEKWIGGGHNTSAFIGKNKQGNKVLLKRIWTDNFEKSRTQWQSDINKYINLSDLASLPKILDFWFCKNGTIVLRDKRGDEDDGIMRGIWGNKTQADADFFIVVELVDNAITLRQFEEKFQSIFGGNPDLSQLKQKGYYNGLKELVYNMAQAEMNYKLYYGDLHPGNFVMNEKTKEWHTVDAGAFWTQKTKNDTFLKFFSVVLKKITKNVNEIQNAIVNDLQREHSDFADYYKRISK